MFAHSCESIHQTRAIKELEINEIGYKFMKNKLLPKAMLLGFIAITVVAFFAFDLSHYFTLEFAQSQRQSFIAYYQQHQILTIMVYMLIYVAVTAMSLPGATIMTLLGGGVFGLMTGTVVISFASSIGATIAFLMSRYVLRDSIQSKFGDKLKTINEGMQKDGAFYLFTLRLVPIFPFFLINLLMGISSIRTARFYWVSQIGMLPGTIVYVNAGDQLASLTSVSGILSPALISSFVLLGVFPLLAKKLVAFVKSRRVQLDT